MRLLAILVAVLALSCAPTIAGAQTKPPDEAPDPSILDGSAQRALDAARASWRRYGARSYRFRIARTCFCPEQYRRARTITVRGGKPVRPPSDLTDVATIPRLHRLIQRQIKAEVADLRVTYGAHGIPRSIFVDVSHLIADEENGYGIDRFKRLR